MKTQKPIILLASKSPRRRQLLSELGFEFEVVEQNIDETFPEDLSKEDVPAHLAQKKAASVQHHLTNDKIILASDTIVLMNNSIYHKPKDYTDAVNILKELSGNVHEVITGVCLLGTNKEVTFSVHSKVHFSVLTNDEIDFYINNFKPYDKAGAYAIQEWIGLAKIKKIEGSYNNIVGLPTQRVYEELMLF
ncbi:MAG: Maf family protein [Saprospiraceae bacterium]|nr:Maf family protein [Saprospiraceae bacterium]